MNLKRIATGGFVNGTNTYNETPVHLPWSVIDVDGELSNVTGELELNGGNVGRMIDGQTGPLVLQIFLLLNSFDQAEENQSWRFVMLAGQSKLVQVVWKEGAILIVNICCSFNSWEKVE